MPKDKNLPKGFKCECGEDHPFDGYVYAHYRMVLAHTCDSCGAKHNICMGRATLKKKGRNVKSKA